MVRKLFLDQCNTIFRDSEVNFGLNPVVSLHRGLIKSRFLVDFSTSIIARLSDFSEMGDRSKITYTLRMFNCGSINIERMTEPIPSSDANGLKERAVSFSVVALRCPNYWDRGVGFDGDTDVFLTGVKALSYDACNWYQAKNGVNWETEGIFTDDEIEDECSKFLDGEESLVVGLQHFEYGSEDLCMDITDFVNQVLDGEITNRGLVLAFVPHDDDDDLKVTKYVGFFSDETNTFYEPFVEVRSSEAILDNREYFVLGKVNRLYFFCSEPLDRFPSCTINGTEYEVTEQFSGVYYAQVFLNAADYEDEDILYDTWTIGDETVENRFIVRKINKFVNPQLESRENQRTVVGLWGIKNDEKVTRDGDRVVSMRLRKAYGGLDIMPKRRAKYRLYTKDAYRQVTVIDWDDIFISGDQMYFKLHMADMVPATYYVDINVDGKVFEDELHFKVVDEVDCLVKDKETFIK